jgi:hypothetical protein
VVAEPLGAEGDVVPEGPSGAEPSVVQTRLTRSLPMSIENVTDEPLRVHPPSTPNICA